MTEFEISSKPTIVTFHADQEHTGLRAVIILVLVFVLVVTFLGMSAWLRSLRPGGIADYWVLVSCITALPLALAVSALAEYILKRTWHSGRRVTLDHKGIEAVLASGESHTIDWSKPFGTIRWTFALKGFPRGGRERRVPGGWYCLAWQLQQDEERFVIYTFMPGKEARGVAEERGYHEILPAEFFETSAVGRFFQAPRRPELPASLLAGNDGIYWLAERRRWSEGLELTRQDFLAAVEQIERYRHEY